MNHVKMRWFLFLLCIVVLVPLTALSQGVTTAAISGVTLSSAGEVLPGANVIALHVPSGTNYGASSRADGRYTIPGMRVGGPYTVTVSYVGYESQARENIYLSLGITTNVDFTMRDVAITTDVVTVTGERDAVFSAERTGAATSVGTEMIQRLPTINRRIEDLARLTPQYSPNNFGFSFAGQDNRLNNMTVDGSYFNNSFGLAGQPGDRTGVAPISLEAIEQIQINIAPFDVRQGNFVGAGVNTVTKSGTNEYSGSAYYQFRHQGLVGTEAGNFMYNPGTFKYNLLGARVSGPVIPNKLFFFTSFENEGTIQPGTTYRANKGGEPVGGNITRVLESDLTGLSSYLRSNFGYETGPFQGYDHEIPATRFLIRFDYNYDDNNKFSLRYTHLDSETDVLASNSSSLGFGTRRSTTNALNFQNTNYIILENIRSIVGEWNSRIADNMSNNLLVGYTFQDESRDSRGEFFPMVDILNSSADQTVYTTFGFEPFTPSNELRYSSIQLQNNFTIYGAEHDLTFGASLELYESENVFFPGSQSAYVYYSLADFYADANDYLANPTRTNTPAGINLRRFQVRWSNIPGQEKPIQPLKVTYGGVYAQDEWQVNKDLRVTAGIRFDIPFFGDTGFKNDSADVRTFRDENGASVKYETKKLPDPSILFSPRVGFNWDVMGDRSTQVRGGTGIFTGRPAYVWISNQIGNTGVLTGFEALNDNPTGTRLTNRPFHPDPDHYKPTSVTGAPASSYELALTDPDFKFPQLWRTNVAVDQKLPYGLVGTAEFMYNKDVNGVYYINANLAPANTAFTGVDGRSRWTVSNRIHANISNAVVLKNQSVGSSWNIAGSLELPFRDGLFAKMGYSYGEAKNTVDPGSIAFGSWNNNQHSGNPNNPGVGFSANSPGERFFATASYRTEYFDFGATTLSLFYEIRTQGNASYVFGADANGDGGSSNDLIYIPRNTSEMNFEAYGAFSAAQQAAAWEAFIQQ
ncbi:MAG: carboxypeptidase regulatory-like domain-containing protein, partial [Bacteroidota bacterium]